MLRLRLLLVKGYKLLMWEMDNLEFWTLHKLSKVRPLKAISFSLARISFHLIPLYP